VDFLLREHRDVAAAKRFFHKALQHQGTPRVITLEAYAAFASGDYRTEGRGNDAASGSNTMQQLLE
jgi:transposase-like protein